MNPVEFCRDTAAPAGSNLHYATLFHMAEERRALYALFALRAEILRIAASTPDAVVAAMRRTWWAEELTRVAGRQARHPVGLELQRLADRIELDFPALLRFTTASGADAAAGSAIWIAAARACAIADADAVAAVDRAGALVDAVETLAGQPGPAESGRLDARLLELERELAAVSRDLARPGARRAEFCRIMVGISAALCAEMKRDVAAIGRARVSLTPLRKLWIAWRIHRRRAG